MSTIEVSPAQTRDVLMEPVPEISLPMYTKLHDSRPYGKVRFAFNPLASHPLSSHLPARNRFFAELSWICRNPREPERSYPWTLRHEENMDLIVVSDWTSEFRREFPNQYDDDEDFYALVREMFCQIVQNPLTEAPLFEPALELERDRDSEEQRLLREYRVDCSRGGFLRTFAAMLESSGLKEPPPIPKIDPKWDYQRFLAHNGQMVKLVRWFSEYTEQINKYCRSNLLT